MDLLFQRAPKIPPDAPVALDASQFPPLLGCVADGPDRIPGKNKYFDVFLDSKRRRQKVRPKTPKGTPKAIPNRRKIKKKQVLDFVLKTYAKSDENPYQFERIFA